MEKRSIISLFSGAGGLDYGFEAAGFSTAVALEQDASCCRTLRANTKWPVIENDIMAVTNREILDTSGLKVGDASLLIGGPPCQPFSKSGYWASGDAKRLDDPRATTLHAYMRVLEGTLPRGFVLENVPGLAFNGKDEGLRLVISLLDGINRRCGTSYSIAVRQLNSANYGVPQTRQRVFIIGFREGQEFCFPTPTHWDPGDEDSELSSTGMIPYRTAWDALADVENDDLESLKLTGKWAELLPSIPEGENYQFHTDRGGGMPLFGWRRRYWTFLLKLAKNRPSWTIQAQPGPSTGPFHWNNRRLSMRELCRLQTIPDTINVLGDLRTVQRQVGNAVPSLMAEVLARAIQAQLFGVRKRGSPTLIPPDRSPPPKPEKPASVGRKYRALFGEHAAHPGTGKGYAAQAKLLL
ncbi:MAG: DNA cytosine methyltransferase [bacterium]|nr:DNA cytosine methyltransferase [bacterium]